MTDASAITALLGPTNTGKTHRAVERMLEHQTGMIGVPLRLLARELYDRITKRIGESRVALVTGEEQRIPARPQYWIATVEAMPDRDVEFVAVDEVQLAAHDQRGHVFTSRILRARGTKETWLMGAGTMRPIIRELVPTALQIEHPRLSRLTYAGSTPLARIPPRSAVVAFSMPHVYEMAERLRARKGGAAVVLGALSPRTRNAQVAMFQAGEVDFLVATDAIGMGLNLEVEHVAFAALRKFDGRDVREVDETELAQIAGRAGRWVQDGTFGALTPLAIPDGVANAIETHRFAPIRRVKWRNDILEFSSLSALRESLYVPSPRKILAPVRDAEDTFALDRLALRPEIARVARNEEMVRLLWDVCTIPDFRKLLLEVHVDFLETLFLELAQRGRLSDDWIDQHVRELERTDGDIDQLVARIAAVRTWTYVANRSQWLVSPREWQEKTRALEDRLSDALHERLVMRFVDAKKGSARAPRARARVDAPVSESHIEVASGHPFAALAALRAPAVSVPIAKSWVDEVADAAHEDLRLEATGRILHGQRVLGEIVRGPSIALPEVRLAMVDGAGAQRRLQQRVQAFARDVVTELVGPVRELQQTAALRALGHRLEQSLGTLSVRDVEDIALDPAPLTEAGLVLGSLLVYHPNALTPRALAARVALATIWFGAGRALRPPEGGAVSFPASRGVANAAYTAIGFPVFGGRAIRADVAERVWARVAKDTVITDEEARELASWLGSPSRDVLRILRGMRETFAAERAAG